MKTIILFLSLVLSASAATLYPVLTDNSGRTFSGGATNLALLNANQTWTGTPTFPAEFFISNGIRYRSLLVTNLFVTSVVYATNAATAGVPTNSGENIFATTILDVNLPRLQSPNSVLAFSIGFARTNVQTSRTGVAVYTGTNTNCVFWSQSYVGDGTTSPFYFPDALTMRVLWFNNGSYTQQMASASTALNWTGNFTGRHEADTSTNFNLKVALASFAAGDPNTNSYIWFRCFEMAP